MFIPSNKFPKDAVQNKHKVERKTQDLRSLKPSVLSMFKLIFSFLNFLHKTSYKKKIFVTKDFAIE